MAADQRISTAGTPADGELAFPTRPRRWPPGRLVRTPVDLAAFVGVAAGVFLSARSWGPGLIGGTDSTAIARRTDLTIRDVFMKGHLNGWSPYYSIGHDAFLVNPPGFTVLIAVLRALTLGHLSTEGAIKVAVALSFAVLPWCVARAALTLGADRRAARYLGILALAVSVFAGYGLSGTFETGLYPFQVATPLFFLALAGVVNAAREPTSRRIAVGAVAVAALVLTHLLVAVALVYVACCSIAVLSVARRVDFGWRSAGATASVGVLALALAAVWALPLAVHRDAAGAVASWPPQRFNEQVVDIVKGNHVYVRPVALFAIAGWAYALARALRGTRRYLVPCGVAAMSVLLAQLLSSYWDHPIAPQMPWRSSGVIGVLALLPSAMALAALVGAIDRRLDGWSARRRGRLLGRRGQVVDLLGLAACLWLVVIADGRFTLPGQLPLPVPELYQVADYLHTHVTPEERIAIQEDQVREFDWGVPVPARWIAWRADRNLVNVFNPELSRGGIAGSVAGGVKDDRSGELAHSYVDDVAELGGSYVVTLDAQGAEIVARSNRVQVMTEIGHATIFRVDPRPDQLMPQSMVTVDAGFGTANYERRSNEQHRWTIEVREDAVATLPFSTSPRWRLTVDGRAVTPRVLDDGRMQFDLPAGVHDLALDYRRDPLTVVGAVISLLTGAGLAAMALRRVRSQPR